MTPDETPACPPTAGNSPPTSPPVLDMLTVR